jgi:exodeoxyribonuclease V beta subunit
VLTGSPAPFDVCGELPTGTTILEASAGTGKTFTIAALTTRLVAEGICTLSELMLVTFSRAATQELRERVRDRLVSAHRALADPHRARTGQPDDVVRLLADADDETVAERRRRLQTALSAFDAATIATTHGFCEQLLTGLGVAGDADPDVTLLPQPDDLVAEVVDDLYVRKWGTPTAPAPEIDYQTARRVARAAVADRQALLVPTAGGGGVPAARVAVAGAVRREVQERKRQRRLIDYDDLLTRVRDALTDPARATAAQARVRERYRYVLVDEFQDTDPVQWDILRLAFHGHTTLVLVGDPKQAIYAFRGADVAAYLAAARAATGYRTLALNWRSDADLVGAFAAVFQGAELGDPAIVVRPVTAAHPTPRLCGPGAPLRLRLLPRAGLPAGRTGEPRVQPAREAVVGDVGADVVDLLQSGATLRLDGDERPVGPADVAVLVRTHDQAARVLDGLTGRGVPAVLAGGRSVFLTAAAAAWLVLLRALEQPHRPGLVRAAALTPFVGWSPADLGTAPDAAVDELTLRVRGWRDVLTGRGVAALLETISSEERLPERILARVGGERELTDVRHIGQALHDAALREGLGPAALVEWQQRRMVDARGDPNEERNRRLESDADAVQVVTIHASKGLQFPVVYLPFAWDRWRDQSPETLLLHDDDGGRLLDVGGPDDPGFDERRRRSAAEDDAEELRLLYVAMTRAQCRVVAWWAPLQRTRGSALHRLLFADRGPGSTFRPPADPPLPDDAAAETTLADWAAGAAPGCIAVERASVPAGPAHWTPDAGAAVEPAVARLGRDIDLSWRRTSYSGLTAALHGPPSTAVDGAGSEPEHTERADEPGWPLGGPIPAGDRSRPAVSQDGEPDLATLRDRPSPFGELPGGTSFGTLVHRILELADPSAVELDGEVARCVEVAVGERLSRDVDAAALTSAVVTALRTPLGPLTGGLALSAVAPVDRLTELDFELPLGGGDAPYRHSATLGAVAGLLRRHLPPEDPLAGYPDALAAPTLRGELLRGYLTGSIDAVLRLRDPAGPPRYLVVDYKTNRLGDPSAGPAVPPTAWDYRPAALAEAMIRAHYPLQALFYTVALHRYLRWRQPGYAPGRHLGGVLYLFLRGMCGPEAPTVGGGPVGVFGWQPSAGLVEELSGLLDRGAAR